MILNGTAQMNEAWVAMNGLPLVQGGSAVIDNEEIFEDNNYLMESLIGMDDPYIGLDGGRYADVIDNEEYETNN